MGASKEHHFTAVTHRWRARARAAEALLDDARVTLTIAQRNTTTPEQRDALVQTVIDLIEEHQR